MKKYLFNVNKQSIALIIVGTVINLMGNSIASYYSLPVYMDSFGTFLVAVLLGPVAGSVTGLSFNIISGFGTYRMAYALVSIAGALTVGLRLYKRDRWDSFTVVGTSVLTGLVMTGIATPLNLYFQNGFTGNIWGDALVEMLYQYTSIILICSSSGELIVNVPDKIITLILLMGAIYIFKKAGLTLDLDGKLKREEEETNNKSNGKKLMAVLLFFSFVVSCFSVIPAEAAQDYSSDYAQRVFDMEDGLNSAEINTITQSGDGYIWAGAYSGLYRYDGTSFEQINLDSKITNAIALFTDSKGRLWIGTNDCGVACFNPYSNEIRFIDESDGLPSNSIRGITEDSYGNIYVSTSSYVCKITLEVKNGDEESETEEFLPIAGIEVYDSLDKIYFVSSMQEVGENQICGVTEAGELFLMEDGVVLDTLDCEEEGNSYYAAANNGKGTFMVGTAGGTIDVVKLADNSFVKEATIDLGEHASVNRIIYEESEDGYFYAAENGFGFVNAAGEIQNLTSEKFNTAISDVMLDKQGNVWFSSSKQGVLELSKNPFMDLFKKAGIEGNAVNTIVLDGNIVYVGTDSGVVSIDRVNSVVIDEERLHIFDNTRVRHILKDSKGNLWFSTYGELGLVYMGADGSVLNFNDDNSDILGSRFRFSKELSDGRIMVASSDGISFFEGTTIVKTLGVKDGIMVPKILSAAEDDAGTLWLGTDGDGVYAIEKDEVVTHFGKEDGLSSEVVLKIVDCDDGLIYVASNGLYFHSTDGTIRQLENFPYTNNYDIYLDEEGLAYVSSSAGVYVVKLEDLLEDSSDYAYSLLNNNRGLTTTLTANAWNAVEENKLYLCCTDGVQVLDMLAYGEFDSHYQIVLQSITRDGEEIILTDGVYTIPSGVGQIEITPAILNYTLSDPLVKMELDGVDKKAVIRRQSDLGSLYYASFPSGDYSLNIQVLDEDGVTINKKMVFLIHKDAKLYEQNYYKFYLIFNLAILLAFITWLVAKMGNMAVINRQYDEIREAKEDAEYANQAKSRFLAQMSHEIRTPINAVLGMDEMILRETKEPDTRGYAKDIYNAGQTLLSLINDILDSSKIESGKMDIVPVEYELAVLIHDLVNMISQRAQTKDLRLEVEVDSTLPRVLFGDDVRIRQVITNILTNAVKYTMTGTVWLRVKGERMGDKLILRIEVEDTGIGIKEEDMPKLFQEYQRIEEGRNRKIEGTGLGMNITIQLLQLMGSQLEVTSVYGKGSKFYFDLEQEIVDSAPMGNYKKASKVDDKFMAGEDDFIAENAKVLVVDDNAMNRKVFRSLLRPTKVLVSEAASGKEALAFVERDHFNIIFMDHMMPEMDGVETMKRMRSMECCDGVPIYVLTANAVTGAKDEYMEMGFDGFLSKPVAVDKLHAALKETLPKDMIHVLTEEERAELRGTGTTVSGPPEDLPDVDGLDWNWAWTHLPDVEMLREGVHSFYEILELQADSLDKFYENLPKDISELPAEKAEGEDSPLDAYRIQVHGMKSAAATIGIVPLAGTAKLLEFAAKDENLDRILSMHQAFIEEWRSYKEKLWGVFGLGPDETDEVEKESGDKELLLTMFELLAPALEELDVDTADEIMEKMKGYSFGKEVDELVKKLNAAVKNLDEDLAKEFMEEMRQKL